MIDKSPSPNHEPHTKWSVIIIPNDKANVSTDGAKQSWGYAGITDETERVAIYVTYSDGKTTWGTVERRPGQSTAEFTEMVMRTVENSYRISKPEDAGRV